MPPHAIHYDIFGDQVLTLTILSFIESLAHVIHSNNTHPGLDLTHRRIYNNGAHGFTILLSSIILFLKKII